MESQYDNLCELISKGYDLEIKKQDNGSIAVLVIRKDKTRFGMTVTTLDPKILVEISTKLLKHAEEYDGN